MANVTLKALRSAAEELLGNKISNRESLDSALPVLIRMQTSIAAWRDTINDVAEVAKRLSDACSKYALAHEGIFDDGFETSAKGVVSGNVTVNDQAFHFSSGYGKPCRIEEGKKLSQDFLASLPAAWTKTVRELDVTAINRCKASAEQLKEHGLFRPVKNTWSETA